MFKGPATRASLLLRLRDLQDREAWGEFVEVYGPLVYRYLSKRGLQDADAADLTQACLYQVAAHMGRLKYDRRQGTFRGWLFTVVRNKLRDYHKLSHPGKRGSGDSGVQRMLESQLTPETDDADDWEREYRYSLLAWAVNQVRPQVQETTWRAFWQTAVEGKPGKEVAKSLGLSVAAVYLAKSRVVGRLRSILRDLEAEDPASP